MNLSIPELCLVVLIGPSGSGKSTFARTHFKPTEIISSDYCRALVSDDENNLDATTDAFDVLRYIAGKRLARGLLTVIDATSVQADARKPLVALARDFDVLPVAIVLRMPADLCHERNRARPDRKFGPHVVRNQSIQLRQSLSRLEREGFRYVCTLNSPDEVQQVAIERQPLWNNRKDLHGPFDIFGDVHGCFDELSELMAKLGYDMSDPRHFIPPPGRKAVFVGDLVDRGPKVVEVLQLVMNMTASGNGLCVPGNHDEKLMRKLRGKQVQVSHGLQETLDQLAAHPPEFSKQVENFIDRMVSHYVLDRGRLVIAHAGMKGQYIGRASRRVREFALYGETTGETDEFGLPVRANWAAEYRGDASIVYGHTPVAEPDWLNRTINIDTGCVFGGKLTALRWPEKKLVSVPARQVYAEPRRPLISATSSLVSAQQLHDDVLDLADVSGKRIISTRLHHNVTVGEERAAAALEVMSRFAVDPKWLIYLPPTMSPAQTSDIGNLLEHPQQTFDYFRSEGVEHVICQEKHMGSRAVVIVCRDEDAARRRFGVTVGSGVIFTRTGRRFFDDLALEAQLLDILRTAITASDLWADLDSDWFCLDCELMPWSAKAQDLLKSQYAAVGSAATADAALAVRTLEQAAARDPALGELLARQQQRLTRVRQYIDAYRQYCWPVNSVNDLKLAPFHLLASENAVHADKDHLWHMTTLAKLATSSPVLMATAHRTVDLNDAESITAAVSWWEAATSAGKEGMVVKPMTFIARGRKGLVQPAVKCRGPEYLRIIYGPEYDAPENLSRLRKRGLNAKRSLALREFALGIESLERFVRREPLRKVHECAFAVLALESEPVDPRL